MILPYVCLDRPRSWEEVLLILMCEVWRSAFLQETSEFTVELSNKDIQSLLDIAEEYKVDTSDFMVWVEKNRTEKGVLSSTLPKEIFNLFMLKTEHFHKKLHILSVGEIAGEAGGSLD